MLTDCLEACQANESCGAVNYETGLCVLFSSNADKLPGISVCKQKNDGKEEKKPFRFYFAVISIMTNV